MRSPTTMGEECPGGRAVFQNTLVLGPSSAGNGASCAGRPELLGPRNWGQSDARTAPARTPVNNTAIPAILAVCFIVFFRQDGSGTGWRSSAGATEGHGATHETGSNLPDPATDRNAPHLSLLASRWPKRYSNPATCSE